MPELEPFFARGVQHEVETNGAFVKAVRVVPFDGDIEGTTAAMDAGAPVVIGGTLPVDRAGRRVGRPDWLVRAAEPTADGRPGYWPVEIKGHKTLADAGSRAASRFPALVSPLDRPFLAAAKPWPGRFETGETTLRADLLQLAHYWRMLEACGHAPVTDGPVWAGVIGSERVVVWTDLAAPRFRAREWLPDRLRPTRRLSALNLYDLEFTFRLEIASTALAHVKDSSVVLMVQPTKIKECDGCEWLPACNETFKAGTGDVSLLPGVGHRAARKLRHAGLPTRRDLADLDSATAANVGSQQKVKNLDLHADAAWIGVHGTSDVYRKRGVTNTAAPRADVEIDLDVEHDNTPRSYLWGALLTNRADRALPHVDGYHPFTCWEPPSADTERRLFVDLWQWLTNLLADAHALGLSTAIYSWSSVERTKLLQAAGEQNNEVLELVHNPAVWVDLHAHVKQVAVTAHGTGLKHIARAAGFEWRDPSASGLASIAWFESAIRGDAAARKRLLQYNEDDLRATLVVRDWLERNDLAALGN